MSTLNSVITNSAASIALESLNSTNSQLAGVQKQVSTGYSVADATDNGAAYAVAEAVRSEISGLGAANQQLGYGQGLVGTTLSALNDVSNVLNSARDVLVALANGANSTTQTANYTSQYDSFMKQIKNDLNSATYNGQYVVSSSNNTTTPTSINVVQDESGNTYTLNSFDAYTQFTSVSTLASGTVSSSTITTFTGVQACVNSALDTYGNASNYINAQISFNNDKVDALNQGLGSLVDADLAKESAMLQSLQIQQQLGAQALSIANQAPSALLKLFQ
jgi:flagellin